MDIPATVNEFKAALESAGISQRFAAKFIMDSTSQGNLSFLLEKGKSKHWSELSCRGRLPYIRMRRWLDSPEEQRITHSQLSMTKGTALFFIIASLRTYILERVSGCFKLPKHKKCSDVRSKYRYISMKCFQF